MTLQTMAARFPIPAPEFTFAGFSWPRRVAMLPRGTTAKRLERYARPVTGPYYHAPRPVEPGNHGLSFYLGSDFAPGLRWEWAWQVAPLGHTGWYTDDFQCGDLVRGIVARLPHGRGFLAGWSMGESMASELDATIYDDETEAAHAADSLAERIAELNHETDDGEAE